MQDLIKQRRSEPWRAELRKALSNRERTTLEPRIMAELHQEPTIASLYIEDKLGYTPEEALAEARRCLDCPSPGCVEACPAHIHIPTFIKHLECGQMTEAWQTLRERSTLSAICSRVCPHDQQCEGGCIYPTSLKQRAVGIGALERYVATYEHRHRAELGTMASPQPSLGIRVAVVGAGPAGLAAAHDLALLGYEVTVLEMLDAPGGVMRTGIPRFRLPAEVIDDEVARLEAYGVHFRYGVRVGRDVSVEELRAEGYAAIFLGTGAGISNVMGVPGEDLPGIELAGDYLYAPNMCLPSDAPTRLRRQDGKHVAIIGGGNTAMDAARTARRLGAERVVVVYRRGMEEMPACRDEVEHALAEGIEFMTLHQVGAYHADATGHVAEMELIEMTLTEPDESGRRRPVPTGQTCRVPIDEVVVCVGVSPDEELPRSIEGLETKWGSVVVVNDRQESSVPLVYAGGDASRGGATVVLAMADGRRAAAAIHARLSEQSES